MALRKGAMAACELSADEVMSVIFQFLQFLFELSKLNGLNKVVGDPGLEGFHEITLRAP